jgi:hypothetical protein
VTVLLDVLGTVVGVDSTQPELLADVRRLWEPFLTPAGYPGVHLDLDVDGSGGLPVTTDTDVGTLLSGPAGWLLASLGTAVNQAALAGCRQLAIHAGVVATGDVAIAFPAVSGTGKSTLTAACLRRGFDYVSDESLCLPYDSRAAEPHPIVCYPRPIALSPWSAELLGVDVDHEAPETLATARDLGSQVSGEPVGLRHVVELRRVEQSTAVLDRAPRAGAFGVLIERSFNHFKRPLDTFGLLRDALEHVDTWQLTYGDARSAADLLWDTFG